jgi:hypothetical protein
MDGRVRTIGNDKGERLGSGGLKLGYGVAQLTFSTPGPYNSLSVHMILVYKAGTAKDKITPKKDRHQPIVAPDRDSEQKQHETYLFASTARTVKQHVREISTTCETSKSVGELRVVMQVGELTRPVLRRRGFRSVGA